MALDKNRRSTAAQYFMDGEEDDKNHKSNNQKVVDWLNEASLTSATSTKMQLLSKVQETIIHTEGTLLDNFLDEVVAFQTDRNADVRKCIVGFMEEASKKDWDLLPRVLPNLQMLLADSSPQVQKRVIQAFNAVYRNVLGWVAKATTVTEDMTSVWNIQSVIKKMIVNLVDSENDGIRTHSVKFLETLVLLQTYAEPDSLKRDNDFSLEDIPLGLKIARRRKLEEEALTVFDLMVKFHGSPHISSVNLMACMGSLTLIAKMRPQFMGKVVAALETLHTNLPPTLSKSQVSSVRKHLKLQLLSLLKHPAAVDFLQNITTLLTDLGATYHEVMKSYPKTDEIRKRIKRSATGALETVAAKKPKVVEVQSVPQPTIVTETSIDLTEQYIMERLCPELATDLVILAMDNVPEAMPPLFAAIYTPIAAAGTQGQIKHVARLLATQLNAAGVGPGASVAKTTPVLRDDDDEEEEDKQKIATLVLGVVDEDKGCMRFKPPLPPPPTLNLSTIKHPKRRALKLSEITRPIEERKRQRMAVDAVWRILRTEKSAAVGGVFPLYTKMVATIGTTSNDDIKQAVLEYISQDLRKRLHLALAWLYEEYSYAQGFNRLPPVLKQENQENNYNKLLQSIISAIVHRPDVKDRETLLYRVYLEAPQITDEAIEVLKELCTTEVVCLAILQELVVRRPPRFLMYINALLTHTAHENPQVRETAIQSVVTLYSRNDLQSIIEEYAVFYLSFLRLLKPPDVLFGMDKGRPDRSEQWTDEAIRACLYLYLVLLPIKQDLIHELAATYVQTGADVKRTILRLVEQPVRAMGMHSPELLKLVEDCPKGSETLVTRIIHILTDKTPPSAELVARVRELYQSRVSDVRFLIPVLNGLPKHEIIAALPKLIKLNPIVVKEVFNRLVGSHSSPISPTDLLVALHTIDPNKCELKTVIKATSLCFAEKQAYTQEILAIVIQQLMEITPLPTLLMRTVIQALSLYPRLIGFVMNVLQRLILKQVWKQKKVWEGFIKCCQRTKPQSFQVLLQLPAVQLADVLEASPDLRQPLYDHVMSFTDTQRAYIPQPVMDILIGGAQAPYKEPSIKQEPGSPSDLTIDIKEEPQDDVEPAPPGMD